MRMYCFGVILLVAFGVAALPGIAREEKVDAAKIGKLIGQLGSQSYEEREQATHELDAIGAPALDALRDALKGDDMEIRRRAEDLVERIEKRTESERALTPTRLRLHFKDTPVNEAVAELARKSSYSIALYDPQNALRDRKVTLDTGETTFWEALDQLCRKAGLGEATGQNGGVQVAGNTPTIVPGPLPPQFLPVVPPQPAVPARPRGVPALSQAEQFILVDAKAKDVPTCYLGAARIRVRPLTEVMGSAGDPNAEIGLPLEIALEPRLAWQRLVSVRIDKALDDQEQALLQQSDEVPPPVGNVVVGNAILRQRVVRGRTVIASTAQTNHQVFLVHLLKGAKESRLLKEVQGVVSAEVRTPLETLVSVENILQATGKTIEGAKGGSIKVLEASKSPQGEVKLRVELDYPLGVLAAAGGVGIGPGVRLQAMPAQALPIPAIPNGPGGIGVAQLQLQLAPQAGGVGALTVNHQLGLEGLSLFDEKGKKLEPTGLRQEFRAGPGGLSCQYTLTYRCEPGQPEPARLTLSGHRVVMVDMPFTFANVAP